MESFVARMATATGQAFEHVEADLERGRWLDADEALAYGLIDEIERPEPTDSGAETTHASDSLDGSGGGTRTLNPRLNRPMLCRLSYPGMAPDDSSARTSPMISRWVFVHE